MTNTESASRDIFDNQLIEVLYAMDHKEDVKDIFLGITESQTESHDSAPEINSIDYIVSQLGIDKFRWSRFFVGGVVDRAYNASGIAFEESDRRQFELNGVTAGEFLTRLVYDKLPIEDSLEGDSNACLSLAVGSDYVLNLKGSGRFDTSYIFDKESADINEDEPSDSEIMYKMTYTADLFTIRP